MARLFMAVLVLSVLLLFSLTGAPAQQIKRYPDGTIEVIDRGSGYDMQAGRSSEEPVYHKTTGSRRRHHGHYRKSHRHRVHYRRSSGAVRHGYSASSGRHGKIPSYTRRLDGVTVIRHADGTVDVLDNSTSASPRKFSGSQISRSSSGDLAVTRHTDGTVDVRDTSSASTRPHR